MRTALAVAISILALTAACGEVSAPQSTPDATLDGGPPEPPPPPPTGRDLAVAAGRMTGGTLTVDVQLGAIDQSTVQGGDLAASTAAPLNP